MAQHAGTPATGDIALGTTANAPGAAEVANAPGAAEGADAPGSAEGANAPGAAEVANAPGAAEGADVPGAAKAAAEADAVPEQVDRELDLTGEVCPYTFVKSKLTLEAMAVGEVLRVIVDESPATDSMPLSLEIEGHDVLSVRSAGDGLREIIVRCME